MVEDKREELLQAERAEAEFLRPRNFFAAIFPGSWTELVGPVLVAAAVVIIGAVALVTSGILNLTASTPHPDGWARFLHYTFERSTASHASDAAVPADLFSQGNVTKGAAYYGMACAHCHGGPGLGQNTVALAMMPTPQYLVTDQSKWSDRELFYIVKHGVKYSAMPAWSAQDRDDEAWALVAFLRQLPKLTAAQYTAMAFGDAAKPVPAAVPPLGDFKPSKFRMLHWNLAASSDNAYTAPVIGFDSFGGVASPLETCVRCHGVDGAGRPGGGFPNIALLGAGYFRDALQRYRSGERHSGYMQNVAVQLSDAQIDALTSYYTAQPKRLSEQPAAAPAMLALGETIATAGLPSRKVGACANCHDITKAAAKLFPAIDGQYAPYLAAQLRLYRAGIRARGAADPMVTEAQGLTDAEIGAVSAWYASRAPNAPHIAAVNAVPQ